MKVLAAVDAELKKDQNLFTQALKQQVKLVSMKARDLYESKKQVLLEELLSSCAPAAAVMVNIEISLVNSNYMEEGATLSRTLLPYLNEVTDYCFLTEETNFIASRFLASLVTHVRDTDSTIGVGFVLFAFQLNPRSLQGLINNPVSMASLKEALAIKKYPAAAVTVMAIFPDKFLWPDLLQFFEGKSGEVITTSVAILAKMDVITDPGNSIGQLTDILAQRSLLAKRLGEVDRIRLALPRLVSVLEKLASLQAETITMCLSSDSSKWEQIATQSSSKEEVSDSSLSVDEVAKYYETEVSTLENPVPLDEMRRLSKQVSDEVEDYRHSELQAAIAGIIVSNDKEFTIAVSPTGSGKTWIQGLVAKYFCNQGKRVVVVEPNDLLSAQTVQKLSAVDFGISITSIDRLYVEGPLNEVVILNEYDLIISQSPFVVRQNVIKSLSLLRGRKVIAFSATSTVPHERLINNCICRPSVLRFKSEYELVHNISPVSDPSVMTFANRMMLEQAVTADINKHFDQHPIVLIMGLDQRASIINHLRINKLKYAEGGHLNVLAEVRGWEYGVLVLTDEEGRGVDSRFKKDAIVLIAAEVPTHHALTQMVGRSSRSRGVCEGILYTVTDERPM